MTAPLLTLLLLSVCAGDRCLPFEWVPDDACRPGLRAAVTVDPANPAAAELKLCDAGDAILVIHVGAPTFRAGRGSVRVPKPSGTLRARRYGHLLVFLRGPQGIEVHDLRTTPPTLTHSHRFGPPADGARLEGDLLIFTSAGRILCRRPYSALEISGTPRPPIPNPHAGRFILEAAVFSGAGLIFPYATFPDKPPSITVPIQGRVFVRLPWERHLLGLAVGGEVSYNWETQMALGYRYEWSREWFADLLLGSTRKLDADDQPLSEQQFWLFVGARLGWVRRFGPLRVGVALTAGASEKMTSLSGQVFLGFRLF